MTPTSDQARPDARRLTAGLILAMGAALYASLIPFRFVSVPLREVYWQLRGLVFDPLYIWSRADFVANILMAVPVGFFAMGVLASRRGVIAVRGLLGTLLHLVLTYPRGRPAGRLDRAAVAIAYLAAVVPAIWGSETATFVLAGSIVGVAGRPCRYRRAPNRFPHTGGRGGDAARLRGIPVRAGGGPARGARPRAMGTQGHHRPRCRPGRGEV